VLAVFALLAGCKDHDINDQIIVQEGLLLSGAQESPANGSAAAGSAVVKYNKTSRMLEYTVTFNNLSGNPAAGHIHASAPRGANSGVLIPFSGLPMATSGVVVGTSAVAADKEQDLLNGLFYINLHTATFPGGEIRGQIEFYNQSFIMSKKGIALSGSQEVPAKPGSATGSADVSYNKNTKLLSYYVTYSNLSGNPAAGHIHGPAARGANASVLFPFATVPAATSGAVSGSAILTAAQEADLLNGLFYFNIHTAANPGGEIRGQIEF
ncbi:CHRD domain-containing protein, partial [Persicitalea sp.]|uniref:CHRD domain-containing protein n=1 Tax=Persicitalea sp. TaxID=3100273 RepID=UPI0035932A08